MDEAEQRAEQYLRYLGFTDIEPQPEGEGGMFPDFRVDGRIGVEVRRLNINSVDETGRLVSNRHRTRSVGDRMRELLTTFGPPINDASWFVRSQFKRPFIKWGKLRPAIEARLRAFQASPKDTDIIKIADNFSLELRRAGNTYPHCFLDGAYDDLDNGGYFVEYERERNLNLCIDEKTRKRNKAALRRNYSEWWLIFCDQIGHGSDFDFPEQMNIEHDDWDKVILLNPANPTMSCEVPF